MLLLSLLASCTKETSLSNAEPAPVETRATGTLVRVTNLDNSVTTYDSPKFRVDQDAENGFLVTLDYGKISAFSVYALQVIVVEEEDELSIIQNPEMFQTNYTDQTQVSITEESNSYLKAILTPSGNVIGMSFIVVDEIDGW